MHMLIVLFCRTESKIIVFSLFGMCVRDREERKRERYLCSCLRNQYRRDVGNDRRGFRENKVTQQPGQGRVQEIRCGQLCEMHLRKQADVSHGAGIFFRGPGGGGGRKRKPACLRTRIDCQRKMYKGCLERTLSTQSFCYLGFPLIGFECLVIVLILALLTVEICFDTHLDGLLGPLWFPQFPFPHKELATFILFQMAEMLPL